MNGVKGDQRGTLKVSGVLKARCKRALRTVMYSSNVYLWQKIKNNIIVSCIQHLSQQCFILYYPELSRFANFVFENKYDFLLLKRLPLPPNTYQHLCALPRKGCMSVVRNWTYPLKLHKVWKLLADFMVPLVKRHRHKCLVTTPYQNQRDVHHSVYFFLKYQLVSLYN